WPTRTLREEEQDRLGRAIPAEYCERLDRRRKAGEAVSPHPGEARWEELPEMFKESNRALADHLPVKLNALGFHVGPLGGRPDGLITELRPGEIAVLARMEHARWCAERWLGGWSPREARDDAHRTPPDLVAWDDLPEPEARVDQDLMAAISRALARVDKGVFR